MVLMKASFYKQKRRAYEKYSRKKTRMEEKSFIAQEGS